MISGYFATVRARRGLPALAAMLWLASPAALAQEAIVDGIAAQVGTRIVLVSEVMRSLGPQEAELRKLGATDLDIARIRAESLERLIEARLIEEVVERLELYARDADVDDTIERIAQENGLTSEQLYGSVTFHGMSRDEYRTQIKRDLERRNVVNAMVGSEVEVSDLDVRILYDTRFGDMPEQASMVRVRQILVTYGEKSKRDSDTACAAITQARARVAAGEAFEDVARDVSEASPQNGGDIGWLEVDQLAGWMSEALTPLAAGDVSEPILLPFGCAILKFEEKREMKRKTFAEAEPELREEVWSREMEKAYRVWVDELRGRTYIDRRGYFADAAQFGQATFPIDSTDDDATP